jgi:peptide deformylase
MILDIVEYPDDRLRRVSEPVTAFDEALRQLIDDMFATMYEAPGVGLAAIQVDRPIRLMVIDVQPEGRPQPLVFANPEIVTKEGQVSWEEGCLSVPGFTAPVQRAETVRVRAQNAHGEWFEMDAEELLAIAIQHEWDHLEGILFVDHLSRLRKQMFVKRFQKIHGKRLSA